MGAIYKVRHRLLGEPRVIKVLRSHLREDPSLELRFRREAQAAARLHHPHLAQLYDYNVDDDGNAYIVMELIRGRTLEELVRGGELPPVPLALEIARQGLRAVGHLHQEGIVHRDVAPDNLMLTRDVDGEPLVKLIDLGLVKAIEGGSGKLTGTGVFVGKFRYAAPELFDESRVTDPRLGDLYSFAVVLYELFTGRYPIAGDSPSSLIAGHLFRPPLDFDRADPDGRVPEPVRRAVLRGMAKEPAERFATAADFAAALAPEGGEGLDDPEVRSYLDRLGEEPAGESPPRRPKGSTQSRIDRQFRAGRTPVPAAAERAMETGPTVVMPPPEDAAAAARIEALIESGELDAARREVDRLEAGGKVGGAVAAVAGRLHEIERIARRPQLLERVRLARRAAAEDDYPAAIDHLRRAAELDPDDAEVRDLLEATERAERRHRRQRELRRERSSAALDAAGPTKLLQNLRAEVDRELGGREEARRRASRSRRERADERVAEADRRARAEDFDGALELLGKALELAPDHAEAQALRASVEACLRVREEEEREVEEVERTMMDVRALLDGGETTAALETLKRAEGRFGERKELQSLHYEAAEAELERSLDDPATEDPAAVTSATRILPTPPGPPPGPPSEPPPAPAEEPEPPPPVEVEMTEIRRLEAAGEVGSALERLQRTIQTHGALEPLRELRYELSQTLLERDAEEAGEEEGDGPHPWEGADVPPPAGSREPGAAAPPGTAPAVDGPVAAAGGSGGEGPSGGVGDLDLGGRVPAPSERRGRSAAAAARERPDRRPELPRRPGGRGLLWAGLLVVVLCAVLGVLLSRVIASREAGEGLAEIVPVAVVEEEAPAPGTVVVDAHPWAEIAEITAVAAPPGAEEPALPIRDTPVILELPPGVYHLTLRHPPSGSVEEVEVEVVSGERLELRPTLWEIDGERYFDELGW